MLTVAKSQVNISACIIQQFNRNSNGFEDEASVDACSLREQNGDN